MPRSVSWPVKRMWTPSVSSEASASDSAWPNSIPPSSIASSRLPSGLRSLRWMVKLSGTRISSSFSLRTRSSGTAVSTLGLRVRSSSPVPVAVGSSYSPASILLRSSSCALLQRRSGRSSLRASTSSGLTMPSLTSDSA